jgi:ribosomal protein L20A (L18A)
VVYHRGGAKKVKRRSVKIIQIGIIEKKKAGRR